MRLVPPVLLILCSLSMPASASAQQPPQRDPQAVAILVQAQTAMGSAGSAIQDSIAQGTITYSDGRTGTITLKTKGSNRFRHEVNLSSGASVLVVAGGVGHVTEGSQTRRLPSWITAYFRSPHMSALSRVADSLRPDSKAIYLGLESVNGGSMHHIHLSSLPVLGMKPRMAEIASEFHVFIEAQTGVVVKTLSYDFSPVIVENRTPVETYFSDYRAVGGVLIPHRIARYIRGDKESEIVLTNVQFNVGLPDTDFQQ